MHVEGFVLHKMVSALLVEHSLDLRESGLYGVKIRGIPNVVNWRYSKGLHKLSVVFVPMSLKVVEE